MANQRLFAVCKVIMGNELVWIEGVNNLRGVWMYLLGLKSHGIPQSIETNRTSVGVGQGWDTASYSSNSTNISSLVLGASPGAEMGVVHRQECLKNLTEQPACQTGHLNKDTKTGGHKGELDHGEVFGGKMVGKSKDTDVKDDSPTNKVGGVRLLVREDTAVAGEPTDANVKADSPIDKVPGAIPVVREHTAVANSSKGAILLCEQVGVVAEGARKKRKLDDRTETSRSKDRVSVRVRSHGILDGCLLF